MLKKIVLAGMLTMVSFVSLGSRTGGASVPVPPPSTAAAKSCPGQICDYWGCYPC